MQECSVHSLVSLQFPWVQCQSLKPVLLQIILLPYTLTHKSSIHMGAMYLYMQELFFTLADTIAPSFTMKAPC